MNDTLGDEALNSLHTKVNYDIFDKAVGECNDYNLYNKASTSLEMNQWKNNVSSKILNALCYAYNKNEESKFNSDDCDYLYFWLCDILYNNLSDSSAFSTVADTLIFFLKTNYGIDICKRDNYNVNQENFKEIKLLFDFSKNYGKLEEYDPTPNKFCSGSFQIYLGEYIVNYNQCKNKCTDSDSKGSTCIAFNKYIKGRVNVDLGKWTCNSEGNPASLVSREKYHEDVAELSEYESVLIIEPKSCVQGEVHEIEAQERPKEETLHREEEGDVRVVEEVISIYEDDEIPITADVQRSTGTISTNTYVDIGHSELRPNFDIPNNSSAFTSTKAKTIVPLITGITVFQILLCKVIINVNKK